MLADSNDYMQKAYEKLVNISADEKKRLEYEAREKAVRDHNYLMNYNWNAGHEKGREEGITILIETCQEFSASKEDTLTRLMNKFSLTSEEAEQYLNEYWK